MNILANHGRFGPLSIIKPLPAPPLEKAASLKSPFCKGGFRGIFTGRQVYIIAFILALGLAPHGAAAARQSFSKVLYVDSMYKQTPGSNPSTAMVPDPQSAQVQVYIFKKSTVLWPQTMAGLPALAPGARTVSGRILVKDPQVIKLIQKFSKQHGVDPRLVLAMIRQESGFNPLAVSPKGAMGLMQLIPETAASMGVEDPFDVAQNIQGGIRFLKICLKRFDQNLPLALAAYNAGPGRVVEHQGVPPFKETHTYVKNIVMEVCGQTIDPTQIKLGQVAQTQVAQTQPGGAANPPAQTPAPPLNLTFFAPPSLEKLEPLTISENSALKKSGQLSIY